MPGHNNTGDSVARTEWNCRYHLVFTIRINIPPKSMNLATANKTTGTRTQITVKLGHSSKTLPISFGEVEAVMVSFLVASKTFLYPLEQFLA